MPRKPKSPCSHPTCPNLVETKFCVEHQKQENKHYEKYSRSPEVRKRYGSAWRKIRARFVKDNPLCVKCLEFGKLTPVEEVHHILPLSKGGTHDVSNLMSLCKSCHSKISADEGDRWRNR
jgi:Restriction endonuclease